MESGRTRNKQEEGRVRSSNQKQIIRQGRDRSSIKSMPIAAETGRGRKMERPEWVPLVDTSSSSSVQKQRRPKSASPGIRNFRTERRVTPMRASRSRSPAMRRDKETEASPTPHEITKGTYWGLYSHAEATRRKTTDYYDQIRKEEDELKNEQNDMIIQEKRERRVSPTSRTNVEREALYRKLRGGDQ